MEGLKNKPSHHSNSNKSIYTAQYFKYKGKHTALYTIN